MDDILAFEDRFYILAGSSLVDQRTLVLKHGDTFAVYNTSGDIEPFASKSHGVFTDGTRFLSRLETRLNDRRPLLLNSALSADGTHILVDMTNPDITVEDQPLPRGTLHLWRSRAAGVGGITERISLGNFGSRPARAVLSLTFEADFADIFEVRGTQRSRFGRRLEPQVFEGRAVRLGYEGLDGITRYALLEFEPPPDALSTSCARYSGVIEPGQRARITMILRCSPPHRPEPATSVVSLPDNQREAEASFCAIRSSNEKLNGWLARSMADIRLLLSPTAAGDYPYAGIPWYSTPFGRDGIITALQLLWVNPAVARAVLGFLAKHQASEREPDRDAEPGKILHEFRTDEMANLGEVPFGRYYGSIDSTPLFVMLAGAYHRATGDLDLVRRLWPNIVRALDWIDKDGDGDGDGFVEYHRRTGEGLINQGWKDAHDSVFHADGALADPPVALCEVQGYVYAAKIAAAGLARLLDEPGRSDRLEAQAAELRRKFHETFWVESLGTYALALDRDKRPCAVRTSNPGHCLWTGIAPDDAAPRIARSLMCRNMFTGWGIRTVGAGQARYNPMSYHNGSVWPHDNAIIAAGLSRYGFRAEPLRLFSAWLAAAGQLDLFRLPELICGFRRQVGNGPTQYPVACSPQAWASGSVFMLLAACIGMTVDGPRSTVRFVRPALPRSLRWLKIAGLRVGLGSVDLLLHREGEDVGVIVEHREGEVRVQVEK